MSHSLKLFSASLSIIAAISFVKCCELPEELLDELGTAYQCYLDHRAHPWCITPCALEAMKLINKQGHPDYDIIKRKVDGLNKDKIYEGFRKMNVGFLDCVKKYGSQVDPKDRIDCLSYKKLGLCMKASVDKNCPDLSDS